MQRYTSRADQEEEGWALLLTTPTCKSCNALAVHHGWYRGSSSPLEVWQARTENYHTHTAFVMCIWAVSDISFFHLKDLLSFLVMWLYGWKVLPLVLRNFKNVFLQFWRFNFCCVYNTKNSCLFHYFHYLKLFSFLPTCIIFDIYLCVRGLKCNVSL